MGKVTRLKNIWTENESDKFYKVDDRIFKITKVSNGLFKVYYLMGGVSFTLLRAVSSNDEYEALKIFSENRRDEDEN